LAAMVAEFQAARARGEYFPSAWFDRLSLDDAYRLQLALIDRRGDKRIGWKVGLTSRAIQQQFQVHEPVFGCLLADGLRRSGHQFGKTELIDPGFEVELCMRLRAPLYGAVDLPAVREAVEVCHPALEIIETRGDFRGQMPLALADNAQQKAFVIGDPVSLAAALDLAAVEARVWINGAEVASGRGDGVLGNPLNSIAWLARTLPTYGRALAAGDYIMTGSFTRQFPLTPGDQVRAEFSGIGAVETRLAA
jgi:2-keto-4-pentenoate hydratase